MSILSTREWATLIWGLLFLVYIMCHKEIRKSFWKVIVIFFDKKLRILWEIILLYVLAITMIFYRSSIWENIYIKDIIIWFLFSGLIYCMNAVSSEADERYIQKVLKDNLKLTMILEFFMSRKTILWYIDMIDGQGTDEDGVCFYNDLFLDLIILDSGEIVEDDRDELDMALAQGVISKEQYTRVNETALYLKERLRINSNWILDYCQETMIKIEKEISEDKCKVYS